MKNTIQNNAWIIVIILFTILAMVFGGCSNDIITDKKYIVEKIVKTKDEMCWFSDKNEFWCITDYCYKYNVGDTIRIKTEKW